MGGGRLGGQAQTGGKRDASGRRRRGSWKATGRESVGFDFEGMIPSISQGESAGCAGVEGIPKPLHRSLVFWGGAISILFVVWAWQDSVRHFMAVQGRPWFVVNGESQLSIERDPEMWPRLASWRTENRDPLARPTGPFPPFSLKITSAGSWVLVLPHWLILLAAALAWAGLLLWRTLRIRRAKQRDIVP